MRYYVCMTNTEATTKLDRLITLTLLEGISPEPSQRAEIHQLEAETADLTTCSCEYHGER